VTLREDIHAAIDEIAPAAPALAGQVAASIGTIAHMSQDLAREAPKFGNPAAPRERLVRNGLADHHKPMGRRTELAAGIAAVVLATLVFGSFAYIRAVNRPHTIAPPITSSSPSPACPAVPNTRPTGTITEYAIPTNPGFASAITAGPDCNLWFIDDDGGSGSANPVVGKVTTSGSFTEYTIPPRSAEGYTGVPAGITAGPDGNLWFTEHYGLTGAVHINWGAVAKVTTSGSFTQYTIPIANSDPGDITAGPDGNLWFTEVNANKVVKVTTSGNFTAYTIPIANGIPGAITTGPDGNLWFTEITGSCGPSLCDSAGKVVKVSTSGSFTEFTPPSAGYFPTGVTAGPDGNLWVTEVPRGLEATGGKVAKVTTSGVFTEYTIPSAKSLPRLITEGQDGNLWFIDAGNVAKVTTSGSFTEYTIRPTHNPAQGITAGPDGNIWFTEAGYAGPGKVASVTT
jgi:virginiamycin B lyase